MAAEVASHLGATIIQCDDFFAATVTDNEWDTCTLEQKCSRCIDWQRMRNEALLKLVAGEKAAITLFPLLLEAVWHQIGSL